MKKIYYLLILLTVMASAQQPPVHYPTPAPVWDFVKYGNTPVSEYKGLVNLNIPLYTINVDNVSLPLDMNYYTGGIRVSEEAGLIGLGWTVNTSIPMIVQQIKDKNDYSFSTTFQKLPPYQGNPAIPIDALCPTIISNTWSFDPSNYYELPGNQDIPFYRYVTNNKVIDWDGHYNVNSPNDSRYNEMFEPSGLIIDTEPDIFTLYIDGRQIKFCRPQVEVQSMTSVSLISMGMIVLDGAGYTIQLIPNISQQSPYLTISGIKVICPNRSEYIFNIIERANSGAGDYTSINYKLKEIKTYMGKIINFNYSSPIGVTETDKLNVKYKRRTNATDISDTNISSGLGKDFTLLENYPLDCNLINVNNVDSYCVIPAHVGYEYYFLQSITTPKEEIDFSYSSRSDNATMKKIDNLEVKNIFSQKVKKFSFNYDYFESEDNATKRLKLLSITEEGSEPYVFEYNATQLPKKNSYSIDYWGFYNGSPNTSFKPDLTDLGYPQFTENVNNDFNSNINYTKACSLEKIIYPTKGYTVFEYETHHFDNLIFYNGSTTPIIDYGGGLRIKSVADYNFDNQIKNKKSYTYFGGKCVNKRILAKAGTEIYGFVVNNLVEEIPESLETLTTLIITATNNNFLNQTENSIGDYIGYDRVIMKEEGIVDIGTTEKKFTNSENLCINPYTICYVNSSNYSNKSDIENGKVIEEKIYDNLNQPIQKKKYSYFNRNYDANLYGMSKQFGGYKVYTVPLLDAFDISVYPITLATFYPISDKKSFLQTEEDTEYFNANSKTITRNYNIGPDGNIIDETSQEYGALFQNMNISTEHTTWAYYDVPLYKSKKANNIVTEIQKFSYEPINSYMRLKKIEIFPNGDLSLDNKKVYYDIYDDQSNIQQYHTEGGITTCVVWGYKKTLPIAKIENVTYSQIQSYCSAIETASNVNNENNLLTALEIFRTTISTQFPNTFIATYTYKPSVGVSTITDAKGDKITYLYDSYGKLINVKDKDGMILSENEYHYKPQN